MTKSKKFLKVTELEQLNDPNLVPQLQKRVTDGRLTFISEESKKKIGTLKSRKDSDDLDPETIRDLWKLLIEDAVTYLKKSDPREWFMLHGEPRSKGERRSLKAFGVDKLAKYFGQFRDFEKILYGAEKYYHEHTLHVFRVWVLGALLLDDWQLDDKHPHIDFFDYVEGKTGLAFSTLISPQEIQSMWCIIALCHDLGYPLQKVDSINEQTRKMLRQYAKVNLQDLNFDVPQQHQFINDFILKFISSSTMFKEESRPKEDLLYFVARGRAPAFRTHTQAKFYLKYSKSLEDFQHGIFSSILLMKSLTYFLESDFDLDELKPLSYRDAKQCAIRREILRAIACHTCEEIYHIRPDTLGFWLILCDELQSWGRPTFEEMQRTMVTSPVARLNKFNPHEVDYELELLGDKAERDERTKVLFRRLHKMLRVAVDAPRRDCLCRVTVKGKPRLPGYKFRFESRKPKPPKFNFEKGGHAWDPWQEPDNDLRKEKLKTK